MKMKATNPLLENKSSLYKIVYYIGPYALIIGFFLLWNAAASSEKSLLPTPVEAFNRLITIWSNLVLVCKVFILKICGLACIFLL